MCNGLNPYTLATSVMPPAEQARMPEASEKGVWGHSQ